MTPITNLNRLLAELDPVLQPGRYTFCSVPAPSRGGARIVLGEDLLHGAVATFCEAEGLSLVLPVETAVSHGLDGSPAHAWITLQVPSSLAAVGLTAAVAKRLTEGGIPANVVAATHHDHLFVPAEDAARALQLLRELQDNAARGTRVLLPIRQSVDNEPS
jgi:hypothetical protein